MKKSKIGILSVIGILVLVVMASGCTRSSNNTTMSNQSQPQSQNTQSSTSGNAPIVKVIASGPWMGQIQDSTGSKSVSGTGSQTFQLSQNPGMVIVSFSKDNTKNTASTNGTVTPDTSTLTVQILDGKGNVVATQTTSADAGNVATSHSF
ncbi:hypothetical protein [Methanobacterium spitsbergense]|uniref:Lipoprotein n=1 Tax=Methanobacterium spitsbergense TaxID=2874285 RepID=A0A8T5UWL9_9EURY|nr:hypothetical protein [Methanobacterium spitsbergense]MBZ2166286.1 hypothetical protein [Methanobacterium spitsbergense]